MKVTSNLESNAGHHDATVTSSLWRCVCVCCATMCLLWGSTVLCTWCVVVTSSWCNHGDVVIKTFFSPSCVFTEYLLSYISVIIYLLRTGFQFPSSTCQLMSQWTSDLHVVMTWRSGASSSSSSSSSVRRGTCLLSSVFRTVQSSHGSTCEERKQRSVAAVIKGRVRNLCQALFINTQVIGDTF